VNNGKDGEDWKCRRAFGRIIDGVGGTGLPIAFELAGVIIVRLIFPIFRFGGVGGFTNNGDVGAEVCFCGSGFIGAVASDLPRLYAAEVLTARFFRFLPRLAGVLGLRSVGGRTRVSVVPFSAGVNREASIAKFIEAGDCGEGPGEGSVIEEESKDTVVVGEDSVDSDAEVEVLFRVW
jgi:hypothetical protein